MGKQAKEAARKGDMSIFGGVFNWFFDGAFPSKKDPPPGNNMKGWKYKADFLWPCHHGGRPDPKQTGSMAKIGLWYTKVAKAKLIDSFSMSDADTAGHIASHCKG